MRCVGAKVFRLALVFNNGLVAPLLRFIAILTLYVFCVQTDSYYCCCDTLGYAVPPLFYFTHTYPLLLLADDGIYEFFQTIDVFGNIISNLPVLGPIRNKIRDDLKSQLDRTLGPTLRGFLKGYTSVAIGRASGFVLSDQNRKAFGMANARLLKSILDRPLLDLLPESSNHSIAKLRTEFFGFLRGLGEEDSSDIEDYAELVYDLVGDKSLDSVGLNVQRVLDASPTLEKTANRILDDIVKNHQS